MLVSVVLLDLALLVDFKIVLSLLCVFWLVLVVFIRWDFEVYFRRPVMFFVVIVTHFFP